MSPTPKSQPRTAESFRAALLAEHKPEGAVEFAFVDTIVECWDTLIRARELRTRMFTNDLEALLFGPDAKKFEHLERYIAKCERNFARAVRDLKATQTARHRAEMTATRKAESEARAADRRASAELNLTMIRNLIAPLPQASPRGNSSGTEPKTPARGNNLPSRFGTVPGESLALRL